MRRTITLIARPKSFGSSARTSQRRLPSSIRVQQRGVKLFAPTPAGSYHVDWQNGPQDWRAWKRVFSETWYNFSQNVNKFAETKRIYYPISNALMFTWGQQDIEKVMPLSAPGRELFVGMNNWILNLRHLAWGRIDEADYLDNFALLKSLYMKCKNNAQMMSNNEQFKASWADWIDHCKSVSKTVYEDYTKESEWQQEVALRDEILKMKLVESAKGEEKDDSIAVHPMTQAWQNPMEDGWAFQRRVLPRFPNSKFSEFVPYDVQILDPLFVKLEILHNMSLRVDQLSNTLNAIGIKFQNTFLSSVTTESANALGVVEAYQAMVTEVESAKQQGVWTEEEANFLKQKLFHEVLQEVEVLSQKGVLPSLKLRYPDVFR